ncbi:MAG TPA: M23 family metallopeptidase [Roseiarcus sp.]|nr:M23 family metallopeptidase [Roseiarcus sp.]
MSKSSALTFARLAARLAATGALGAWLAGCSSDATRLSGTFSNPFGNPFATAANDQPPASNASAGGAARPVAVSALAAPAASGPKPSAPQPVTGFGGSWSVAGGSPVVVAQGETLDSISQRYGVPQSALLQANGFATASQVRPGTHLIVPVYNADGAKTAPADHKSRIADAADSHGKSKGEKREKDVGKNKAKDAKETAKDKAEKSAEADSASKKAHDKAGAGDKTHAVKDKHDGQAAADAKAAKPSKPEESVVAKSDTPAAKKSASDRSPTGSLGGPDQAAASSEPMTAAQADAAGASPEFRWPARGRIIQGFNNGNDGINIAVPEGTSVKAAESGVVAYAGSELKGYGNLVLIRHPNGYVTAYANNKELDVKRGDTVKRGQIIAKSGQSGNVSTPQLHFELRKGSTPVDPTSYLAGL